MRYMGIFAGAALGGLILTAGALAQEETERPRAPQGQDVKIWAASDITGMPVRNRQGEELGDVEDIVVDVKSGDVVYLAIAVGETLDLGGKLFAVPPQALTLRPGAEFIGMEARKADLEAAEGFNKDAWPNAPGERWMKEGQRKGEGEKAQEGRQLLRTSKMTGYAIYGKDNEQLGDVNDIVIDTAKNKIAYVVLGHGGVAGVGEKFFAIAPGALQYKQQNQTFVLNATEADFKNQEGFSKDNWPTTPDPRFKGSGGSDREDRD